MDEATAFVVTLSNTTFDAPTACEGWTAHELVAHLAAGAVEMSRHVERALSALPDLETSGFVEREGPFVAMDDQELRGRLLSEAIRLNVATEALGERGLAAVFSGRRMSADEIRMHGRSEAAVHRWDLCGDDEIGRELLGQTELTRHAVKVLNTMLPGSRESPAIRAKRAGLVSPTRWVFGCPGQPDVVVVMDQGGARFEMGPGDEPKNAVSDAATRLLALWGRRSPSSQIDFPDLETAEQIARFLWTAPGELDR